MPELLLAQGLGMRFARRRRNRRRTGDIWAVRGVDLRLRRGEILGIVGESGAGKSTVGRMLLGLVTPTEGRVVLSGNDVTGLPAGAPARRGMQMVFQDPASSVDPRARVFDIVTEGLVARGDGHRSDLVAEALGLVNLPLDIGRRMPSQCSGGELQRVGIARALIVDPDVVVADEPFSAVDVSTQSTLVQLLSDIRARRGTAFVIVSHDLHVMRRLCDRIVVMYAGTVCETGATQDVMESPRHPYTAALVAATNLSGLTARDPGDPAAADDPSGTAGEGCPYAPACPRRLARCEASAPALVEQQAGEAGRAAPEAGRAAGGAGPVAAGGEGEAGGVRKVACWNPLGDPVAGVRRRPAVRQDHEGSDCDG